MWWDVVGWLYQPAKRPHIDMVQQMLKTSLEFVEAQASGIEPPQIQFLTLMT